MLCYYFGSGVSWELVHDKHVVATVGATHNMRERYLGQTRPSTIRHFEQRL